MIETILFHIYLAHNISKLKPFIKTVSSFVVFVKDLFEMRYLTLSLLYHKTTLYSLFFLLSEQNSDLAIIFLPRLCIVDIDFKVWSHNNTLPLDSLHSSTSTFKAHPYSSTQTVFHFLFQYITKLLWAILLISDSCSCDKKERASWMVSISMHGLEIK